VFEGLRALLASGTKRRRAVISLPTGGGKTRVTVEAAVRLVLAPEGARAAFSGLPRPTSCASRQCRRFARSGSISAPANEPAHRPPVGRNPNPTGRDLDKPVVVVASIQTLNNRVGAVDLEWLRKPGLVVVDECHHAITPSYSALLRWLDAEAPRPGAAEKDEPAIVGLSATPFRTDDDESQRLARRFDSRWLPSDQEQLYARLRSQGGTRAGAV
jgi:ERCC4-related helicase